MGILKGYNSICYYYSIVNKKYNELAMDLENSNKYVSHEIREFDYRTKITTLLGNKYYIGIDKPPYGYKINTGYNGKSNIYENKYYLPFATLYTNYISNKEYESLSPIEKETSLLKTVSLDEKNYKYNNITKNDSIYEIKEKCIKNVKYDIKDDDNILNYKTIKIEKNKKNELILDIDKVENSELYIDIQGLDYKPYTKEEIINLKTKKKKDKIKIQEVKNEYKWYEENYSFNVKVRYGDVSKTEAVENKANSPYYFENSEFLINLGYFDEADGKITLTFSKIGTYTFDSIKVIAVSMDDYEEDINNLRKSNFEVLEYDDGYLKGKANPEKDGILQFSTIYTKGFDVYVDGKKVDTFEANKYFLGINIEKGEHIIELKYHTPFLKEGLIISIIGIVIFILVIIFEKKKKLKNSQAK